MKRRPRPGAFWTHSLVVVQDGHSTCSLGLTSGSGWEQREGARWDTITINMDSKKEGKWYLEKVRVEGAQAEQLVVHVAPETGVPPTQRVVQGGLR